MVAVENGLKCLIAELDWEVVLSVEIDNYKTKRMHLLKLVRFSANFCLEVVKQESNLYALQGSFKKGN